MPTTITTPPLELLSIERVASWLGVSKTTVEGWVYNQEIASFKKGGLRKINREDVIRFVALNTIKPRRPEWLTVQIESEFHKLLSEMIAVQVRQHLAIVQQAA